MFSFNGRLMANQGERRFSASLRWSQGEVSRILLTTPLGQALASIDVDAGGARLTTADGRRYAAGSLSDLARRGLGLSLPLEHLPWWMSGRDAPGAPATPGTDGFTQHGWTVRYGTRDARGRPLRIDAECLAACSSGQLPGTRAEMDKTADARPETDPATLRVRLIIDQWLDP
ncbi:MAG: outer membrane lipoprotein LolB [Burkholderiales bacterium]